MILGVEMMLTTKCGVRAGWRLFFGNSVYLGRRVRPDKVKRNFPVFVNCLGYLCSLSATHRRERCLSSRCFSRKYVDSQVAAPEMALQRTWEISE